MHVSYLVQISWKGVPDTRFNHSEGIIYNDWLRRELDLDIRGTCARIPRRDGAENMTFVSFGHNPRSISTY